MPQTETKPKLPAPKVIWRGKKSEARLVLQWRLFENDETGKWEKYTALVAETGYKHASMGETIWEVQKDLADGPVMEGNALIELLESVGLLKPGLVEV